MYEDDDATGTGGEDTPDKTVPLAALEAERGKRQELATRLAEYEAAEATRAAEAAAAATAAAAKRGEFETLHAAEKARADAATEKLTALQARETTRLEALKAKNDTAIEALPEDFRALIPAGLDLDATAAQIERVAMLANTSETLPAGTRRGGGGKPAIPEACKAEALRLGRDPKIHFETVWNASFRRKARGET